LPLMTHCQAPETGGDAWAVGRACSGICIRLCGFDRLCFADLQACHAAARETAVQAEHAHAAADAAAAAVLNAKKSVGDAYVSAEAQAQANKAGEPSTWFSTSMC
jgi:hypothetical protein